MQNFYAIEIEAKFHRHARQRLAAAELRADQARPQRTWIRWSQLPRLFLARSRAAHPAPRFACPPITAAETRLPRAS